MFEPTSDNAIKSFKDSVIKFSDSLIASTSSSSEDIQIWEPKTLAPYEPISDSKFVVGENALCINSNNFIYAGHSQKHIMNVWQWDKKEPLLRFPLRDQLSVFKTTPQNSFCAGADNKGRLYLWSIISGEMLVDIESAHFM